MDLQPLPLGLWLLLVIVLVVGARSSQTVTSQDDATFQKAIMKRMETIQTHLADVSRSMGDLDEELAKALYNCLGLHSELCEALEVDARLTNRQRMASAWSPGKRSSQLSRTPHDPKVNKYKGMYDDLKRKRAMVKRLSSLIKGADNYIGLERKRSCSLNLGFHCQTEEIADFADMLNYLQSPNSPGRKRSVRAAH